MKILKYFVFCLVILTLSCASVAPEKTKPWLDSRAGITNINMTGVWDAGGAFAGGWGEGRFTQTGNRISGTLGAYNVDGAVSGTEVFLVLYSANRYYTAQLKKEKDGSYIGKAVEDAVLNEKGSENAVSYLMFLKQVSNIPWLTREAATSWLKSLSGVPPSVNITGVWDSGGAVAWGEGRFYQEGNRVLGTLGLYNVDGVVSGRDIYLVLYARDNVYYTANLKPSKNGTYTGKVVEKAIVGQKGTEGAVTYLMTLKKASQ